MLAIMTPQCLKVRYPPRMAFTLMARLSERDSRTDAFRVLKTCEAIYLVPSAVAYVIGLGAAATGGRGLALAAAVAAGRLVGHLTVKPQPRLKMLLPLGHAWTYVHGYGLLLLAAVLVMWRLGGWPAVVWWLGGWTAAVVMEYVAEFSWMGYVVKRGGPPLWWSEYAFIIAYRLHARRVGADLDVVPDREEIDSGRWEGPMFLYSLRAKRAFNGFDFGEDGLPDDSLALTDATLGGDDVR